MNSDQRQTGIIEPLTGNAPGKTVLAEDVVSQVRQCAEMTLSLTRPVLSEFLVQLDQEFLAYAEDAVTNQAQSQLFEVLRTFRERKDGIAANYLKALERGFADFCNRKLETSTGVERFQGDLLALVENDDLEETIAISSITRREENRSQVPLWLLNQRLTVLNGQQPVSNSGNPVAPVQFCESLRAALSPLALDIKQLIVAYKLFDACLGRLLREVYEQLNMYLEEQGVLPNLDYSPQAGDSSGATSAGNALAVGAGQLNTGDVLAAGGVVETAAGGAVSGAVNGGTRDEGASGEITGERVDGALLMPDANQPAAQYQLQLLNGIRRLQAIANTGYRPVLGDASLPVFSQRQLEGAIQQIQQTTLSESVSLLAADDEMAAPVPPQSIVAVSEMFSAEMDRVQPPGHVADKMQETIDLVAMLFDSILEDEDLPDSIKALLSYLHTPFLKLSISDPDFLARQTEHPARLLLNSLAEAGAIWGSDEGTQQNQVYRKIKDVISQVLKKFEGDARLFIDLHHDFQLYTQKLKRRQQLLEKRIVEKAQGKEVLQQATRRVMSEVNVRVKASPLASSLLPLLKPWSDYLVHVWLRHSDQSMQWSSAISTLNDLVWSVQPKASHTDRKRLGEIQGRLHGALLTGFDIISFDKVKGEKILQKIKVLQTEALKVVKIDIEHGEQVAVAETAPELMFEDDFDQVDEPTPEESEVIDQLDNIEFGALMEFEDGKRIKVAWYNTETKNYVLVDQMGKEVGTKKGMELAQWMLQNSARIIEGVTKPLFERALETIFQNLNSQIAS